MAQLTADGGVDLGNAVPGVLHASDHADPNIRKQNIPVGPVKSIHVLIDNP